MSMYDVKDCTVTKKSTGEVMKNVRYFAVRENIIRFTDGREETLDDYRIVAHETLKP